jgi:hypothetical protein
LPPGLETFDHKRGGSAQRSAGVNQLKNFPGARRKSTDEGENNRTVQGSVPRNDQLIMLNSRDQPADLQLEPAAGLDEIPIDGERSG